MTEISLICHSHVIRVKFKSNTDMNQHESGLLKNSKATIESHSYSLCNYDDVPDDDVIIEVIQCRPSVSFPC